MTSSSFSFPIMPVVVPVCLIMLNLSNCQRPQLPRLMPTPSSNTLCLYFIYKGTCEIFERSWWGTCIHFKIGKKQAHNNPTWEGDLRTPLWEELILAVFSSMLLLVPKELFCTIAKPIGIPFDLFFNSYWGSTISSKLAVMVSFIPNNASLKVPPLNIQFVYLP